MDTEKNIKTAMVKQTTAKNTVKNIYDDDNIPEIDTNCAEPLPESSRPRQDGPGGN